MIFLLGSNCPWLSLRSCAGVFCVRCALVWARFCFAWHVAENCGCVPAKVTKTEASTTATATTKTVAIGTSGLAGLWPQLILHCLAGCCTCLKGYIGAIGNKVETTILEKGIY